MIVTCPSEHLGQVDHMLVTCPLLQTIKSEHRLDYNLGCFFFFCFFFSGGLGQ